LDDEWNRKSRANPTADSGSRYAQSKSLLDHYWQSKCGSYTLYHGDCLALLPYIDGVDAVVTDPPYGIARTNHGGLRMLESRGMIANDDSQIVGQAVIDWANLKSLPLAAFASPRAQWAGNWRNLIVWDKGGAVGGGGDLETYLKLSWELIQVARNKKINGIRDTSVWRHVVTQLDFENHPNEKPIPLMERLIDTLFFDSGTILDPFAGSSATGIACVRLNRRFIGIELHEPYCEISAKRMEREIAQGRLFKPEKPVERQHAIFIDPRECLP